ncbi:MAG: hypothetical protein J1E02_03570, partial [Coprobacter sp.]|nr:hypothetical protein [Coprobacter sp.]
MTTKEITDIQNNIYRLLSERRLKEAFGLLGQLMTVLKDWQISESLNEMETSYKYMIRYMLDGFNDPERKRIYDSLVLSTYQLTDKAAEKLLERECSSLYYNRKRYIQTQPEGFFRKSISDTETAVGRLALNLSVTADSDPNERNRLKQEVERYGNELFLNIWTNYPATDEDCQAIERALTGNELSEGIVSLVVSALTLNLLHRYDERKLSMLLETYNSGSAEVRLRALCGALMVMDKYSERIALSPAVGRQIEALKENPAFCTDTRNIFLQFIKSRDTERIARKFTEELLPEMIKISPALYKKIKPEELMNDITAADKNPEWQEILDQAGITDKLKELTHLQMEGADIFMSTFANLKHFAFFHEAGNWLLPFTTEHTALNGIFAADGTDESFKKMIRMSHFLCNSDKYSFCLSLTHMPQPQRQMMISQFNTEGMEMENLEKEEAVLKKNRKNEHISNQYIQDLYRFFRLHPRKDEFENPFSSQLNLYRIPILKSIFDNDESLQLIGEFYFRKEYYDDALEIFRELATKQHSNSALYQKIGYCLQMEGNYERALEEYLKAEMITPESFWTIRRIAQCYRHLKKPEMALEYYHRAEKLRPDNLSIEMNIGHCYLEQKDYGAALRHYFKVDYLDPKSSKTWRSIAWCSFLIGKCDQAQRYYEKILAEKPSALDFMNAGHTEFALGNIRRAIELYRQSVAADSNNMEKFLNNFSQDTDDLIRAGISASDIPILLD